MVTTVDNLKFLTFCQKGEKNSSHLIPYKKKIDAYLYFYLVLLIADPYFSSQIPYSLPKEHDDVNTHMDLIKDVHTGIQCKSNLEMKHDNY